MRNQRVGRIGVVLAGMAALVAASFGGVAGGQEGSQHLVVLKHAKFEPPRLTIRVGESVTWRNDDADDPQSVTADDGSFDSSPGCTTETTDPCMHGGDVFRHTFDAAGRFPYFSRTEGGPGGEGMSGVIEVVGSNPPAAR